MIILKMILYWKGLLTFFAECYLYCLKKSADKIPVSFLNKHKKLLLRKLTVEKLKSLQDKSAVLTRACSNSCRMFFSDSPDTPETKAVAGTSNNGTERCCEIMEKDMHIRFPDQRHCQNSNKQLLLLLLPTVNTCRLKTSNKHKEKY